MSQPAGKKPLEVLDISRDAVKHYVRINGWVEIARERYARIQTDQERRDHGLRYFTLCGKDGIDIFLFQREGLINDDGRGFPSIFYCEGYYPSFAELTPILGRTRGSRNKFEDLINYNWFKTLIQHSPFDVVNLDFSGSCFPQQDPPFSRTLRSINVLISLQKGHRLICL